MRSVSTIYDKEPFERERPPKEQAERDEWYAENKKILIELRHHLDRTDHFMRAAKYWLEGVEHDIDPSDLEDAFLLLAAAEKSNEELVE